MAVASSRGYIAAQRQSAFGTPADMTTARFFAYRNAPRAGGEVTNNRYRESPSGFDVGLSLKEGIKYMAEFPILARPTSLAYLFQALTGPGAGGAIADQVAGGGWMSNGLVRPPKLAAGGAASTLAVLALPGATTITVAAIGTMADTEKIVIGWGPNMEFKTITGAPAGNLITLDSALKYPHSINEPVYEVTAYTTVSTLYVGTTSLAVVSHTGFANLDTIAVVGMYTDAKLGSEYGQSEEKGITAAAANVLTLATALSNRHSVGAYVYIADDAIATSRVHGFEPVSALGRVVDYFTVERAVSNLLIERMADARLGTFELSGESPGPLECNVGWRPRTGTPRDTALVEDYTNQGPDDLPFTMPTGKYVISFGAQSGDSDQIRQFTFQASNGLIDDIYTDDIVTNDVLHVSRDANLSCQFYFKDRNTYMTFMYGAGFVEGSIPSRTAVFGQFLANWTIDVTHRACVYIPRIVWEAYPVNTDAEPKAIVVEAVGAPLRQTNRPIYLAGIQNADLVVYP